MTSEYSNVRSFVLWTAAPAAPPFGLEPESLTFTSALLVLSDPPTTADRNAYGPTITRLYVGEKLTLKETVQIMEREHQFNAT
jgi:hypothetical protein